MLAGVATRRHVEVAEPVGPVAGTGVSKSAVSRRFVAATTALTKLYTPAQRPKTQAVNDVVVFGTVALCTALSAVIYEAIAWAGVLYVCLGVATAGLVIGLVNLTSHRLRA